MKRLGVLGTFVWDTIWTLDDQAAGRPFETWGGVAYSLAAAAASRPEGWEIVPVARVGADLADEARRWVERLPGVRVDPAAFRVVPEPNNRVALHYLDAARRDEVLTGGVRPWPWEELARAVEGLDALYVNFLSGFEMEMETAERLRDAFAGPLYADLHSLFLGPPGDGPRAMRPLPQWERWAASFHALQMNVDELRTIAPADESVGDAAARILKNGPGLAVVTRGGEGVTYAARAGFPDDPLRWPDADPTSTGLRSASVPPLGGAAPGDPTGAGDVWGATFFSSLLAGFRLDDAVRRAHAAAERKLGFRGAGGLYAHLAESAPGG